MAELPEPIADSGGEAPEQSDVAGTSKLNVTDLSAVLEEVHDAHGNWYGIGLRLGLEQTVLQGVEKEYSRTEEMLREMLGYWLKQVTPMPSWVALIEALRSKTVKEPSLAKQLEKRHISPHSVLTQSVSNITDRHKHILGQLQDTAKIVDSQLGSYVYGEILQKKKDDPSDEAPEAAQEKHVQRSQSEFTGLRTESERALQMNLKELMGQITSLLEEKMEESELSPRVPEDTETKEPDPLKDEMDHLRTRNSKLEEELHSSKDQLKKLGEKSSLLSTEKEDLQKETQSLMERIVEKNDEIAKRAEDVFEKAKDIAKKSADYKALLEEKQQVEKEVKNLAEENQLLAVESKVLKSHLQSLEEMPAPPEPSDCTETSTVEQ